MLTCQAVDWTPEPQGFLSNLQQPDNSNSSGSNSSATATTGSASVGAAGSSSNATELRQFGLQLHRLWGLLCRQVREWQDVGAGGWVRRERRAGRGVSKGSGTGVALTCMRSASRVGVGTGVHSECGVPGVLRLACRWHATSKP